MKAVTFDVSLPKYVASTAMGKLNRRFQHGPMSCVGYREVPEPALPGDDWVKVRTIYGGICGSDLGLVYLHDTPTLSPFASDRFVIGHENTGVIVEKGSAVKGFEVGDRIAADIVLPCATRGLEPCQKCADGNPNLCYNFAEGKLEKGTLMGACGSTGGSWGEYYVAHETQLHRIPDGLADKDAMLVDPLCSALHPVLRHMPGEDEKVLVLGAGIIGLMVVASLRAMGCKAQITVAARYGFQAEAAEGYGTDHVVRGRDNAEILESFARITGAKVVKPMLGDPYMMGGFTTVFNCVGSEASVKDSLRYVASSGKVVLVGLAGVTKLDWTLVWFKEVTIAGIYCYALDPVAGATRSTVDLGLELLASNRVATEGLVTHVFDLADYRKALVTATEKSRYGSVKVLLKP